MTMIAGYELHEACALFPPMSDAELRELAADIAAHGLLVPIVLHEGRILDGRNRLLACERAGVAPRFEMWAGTGSPVAWVVSQNVHRRHLDASQRAMVAAKLKPMFEAEARARMLATQNNDAARAARANLPEQVPSRSRDEAAAVMSVSPRSVESAARVLRQGVPALIEAVERGEIAVSTAAEIATEDPEAQVVAIAWGEPHVSNIGNDESRAPREYVDAARVVMGAIDLDPASTPAASAVVGATAFYTTENNGLAKPWSGRVWLTPPCEHDVCTKYATRLVEQVAAGDVTHAVVVTTNATEAEWFQTLAPAARAIAFPRQHVPAGHGASRHLGQAVFYFGPAVQRFVEGFRAFGCVVTTAAGTAQVDGRSTKDSAGATLAADAGPAYAAIDCEAAPAAPASIEPTAVDGSPEPTTTVSITAAPEPTAPAALALDAAIAPKSPRTAIRSPKPVQAGSAAAHVGTPTAAFDRVAPAPRAPAETSALAACQRAARWTFDGYATFWETWNSEFGPGSYPWPKDLKDECDNAGRRGVDLTMALDAIRRYGATDTNKSFDDWRTVLLCAPATRGGPERLAEAGDCR